ncbi:Mucin-associated surface protein (MASP) [Trypanosoma cruzi]|uniref:Mucin-associated surface protein (MASP), putative n=2 Tax=Trypanosoma cruzi TaxID=5693 RepID=Q4CVZ1_TRYCC|nr:mucin-associated surface protein (MASP), putative [Trypanosoma cruzi]EAN84443.1 mucin-associated surface protein (MASP), putative [Trypanosoma cruzi]PWV09453.1 Mucin-associated surface protein (MASP) [Trypanosoma cruzi]|eukprot:XP_806294.1 mucin-associated surface protein (MASP) [Trypanosoma cruzi strain CL Brener]
MAMMMTGRVLLVCALCVLWCGVCGVYARNPDNNSLGGYMASGGFGRNKSFLSTGASKNLSTPPLLSASFISAIQAEAREGEVSSPGVTDSPLSGATGLSPAFSGLGPAVPGPGPGFVHGHVHGPAGPGDGAAAFSGLGAAGPDPVRGPAFSGPDANIFGAPVPGNGPAAIPGAPVPGHGPAAIPGAPVPGNGPAFSGLGAAVPGDGAAAFSGRGAAIADAAIPGAAGPVRGVDAPIPGPAVPGDGPAFSGLGAAGPGTADPAAIPGSAVLGHGAIPGSISDAAIPGPAGPGGGPALSGLGAAFSGAGHSVAGGSEPPNSRSVVISSNQGGNGKTTPISVSSDEQIVSSQEVLAQKETGSQHTSLPEEQPTVSSNNEKQRNNFASAGGRSLGHNAAGHELQDSLEEQNKNEHSQTNETKKSSGDQITESQRSGKEISEVSNTKTHGIKTQQPKTNPVNEKNYSQSTDASHTTSPLLLLVVACAAAAAVVAA